MMRISSSWKLLEAEMCVILAPSLLTFFNFEDFFVCSLTIALEEHLSILLVTFSDEPVVAVFRFYQAVAWRNERFKRAESYSSNDLYRNVLILLRC